MLSKAWRIGALCLLLDAAAACSGITSNPGELDRAAGTQMNVTEHGIEPSAVDPVEATLDPAGPASSAGWLTLHVGDFAPIYLPAGGSPPDLSVYHFGRTNLEFPSQPTHVDVQLSGLDWHSGDGLQLVAPNVGLSIHELETLFTYPSDGSTTTGNAAFDWSRAQSPLLDATKGDITWIAQMSLQKTPSGRFYSTLTRAGTAAGFTLSDGVATRLVANLAPVAQNRRVDVRWNGASYAALASAAGPYAQPAPGATLSIRTMPEAVAANTDAFNRYYMYTPSVVDFGPIPTTESFDATVSYGDPFATANAKWTEFVTMVYAMPVIVPHVAGTHAMVIQAVPVDALLHGAIEPAISPVRNVRVNGETADAPRTGIGRVPTISWEAPATGVATSYAVKVQAVTRSGQGYRLATVGTFRTRSTSLSLPEPAMGSVDSYVLTITAVASGDRDLTSRPRIGSLPYASADYVTAQLTR